MMLTETDDISPENFESTAMYWLNTTKTQVAPKTTLRRITSIKRFAKWAGIGSILEDYVAPVAARSLPHPLEEGIPGINRMCEVSWRRDYAALVALGGLVGCRVAESISVVPTNFDLKRMLLTIRGKGDKTRIVPVSSDAWTWIAPVYVDRFEHPNEPLLQFGDRSARSAITALGRRAGISRSVSSHDLRATFATAVYHKVKDIQVVRDLLGHASVTTTQTYTLVEMRQMIDAVEGL